MNSSGTEGGTNVGPSDAARVQLTLGDDCGESPAASTASKCGGAGSSMMINGWSSEFESRHAELQPWNTAVMSLIY